MRNIAKELGFRVMMKLMEIRIGMDVRRIQKRRLRKLMVI